MKKLLIPLCAGLALAACGKKDDTAAAPPAAAEPKAEQVVYFCNWSEYIDPTVLDDFTKQTGIKVVYSTYDSNEALYAKMKLTDEGGCDVVVPSTYFISKMSREGMLAPLDKAKLPNLRHLDPALLDEPYDPGNALSVPYMWGMSAIAVNSAYIEHKKLCEWE